MNFERGFPIPLRGSGNGDSWSSMTPGMAISHGNGNRDSWSSIPGIPISHGNGIGNIVQGGDSSSVMTPRRPIPIPMDNGITITQERPIRMGNGVVSSTKWDITTDMRILQGNGIVRNEDGWNSPILGENGIVLESSNAINMQENQSGNEDWQDLLGMYTGLLQEETLDLNKIVKDLNPTPPPPPPPPPMIHDNRSQSWVPSAPKWNPNSNPCLNRGSNQVSTSASCCTTNDPANRSLVPNSSAQTQIESNKRINDGDNTKDGFRPCYNLNSPLRSEPDADSSVIGSFPFAPITPDTRGKKNVNIPVEVASTPAKNVHENQTVLLEDAENLYNELLQTIGGSPPSAISTTQKGHVSEEGDEHGIDLNKTPNQKTPARRKKHRPKVIREGKPKRTPKPKDPKNGTSNETRVKRKYVRKTGVNSSETQVVKRKYVRKKGVEKVESRDKSGVDEVVEIATKSCKKQLNFDSECVAQDVNSNAVSRDVEQERIIRNILETSAMNVAQQNKYISAGNQQNSFSEITVPTTPLRDRALNVLVRNMTSGNSVNGWTNEYNQMNKYIHREGIGNNVFQTGIKGTPQSFVNGGVFDLDERRGIKRQSSEQMYSVNVRNYMDSLRLYQRLLVENHKKMKMQNESSYFAPLEGNSSRMNGVYGNGSAMQLVRVGGGGGNSGGRQFRTPMATTHQHQVSSGMQLQTIKSIAERTQRSTRDREISWNLLPPTPPKEGYRSAVATYPTGLLEKKPNSYNQRLSGVDQMIQPRYQQSSMVVRGRPRKQKVEATVDYITYRLESLRIYDENEKERNALVLYGGSKAMIPFEPIKKRNPRPKVDLDPETDRLWRLLMGKEGVEGAEETLDKDKEKWWEEERRVFRGRADSFIARMHLVQGDRRFSRWKGSVVDSVIGVFLTQNVSDHLSSSAFMSLAAKFPQKTTTTSETHCQDGARVIVEEPIEVIKCEKIMRQPVSDQSFYVSCESNAANKHNKISEEEVILSQDSFDSSTIQTVDEIRSSSGSNSEAEDHTNGFETSKQSEKRSVFKESSEHNDWSTLINEQAINTQRLPKESLNFRRNGTQKQDSARFGGITINFEEGSSVVDKQSSRESTVAEASSNVYMWDPPSAAGVDMTKVLRERKKAAEDDKNRTTDWDGLRKQVLLNGGKRERSKDARDSLDYEALRHAHVNEISDVIKERGMNNLLADRIKDFLNRLVRDHGSIDLEWLRDAPPDRAKDYLLSFRGLGLKSVECVRLLTLHHLAFPVDTNVGRIAVRLGWVPLQPLPESVQLHLLEMYPVLESIQKYLWPRLCKLDQLTLYELHYQMITFGKVFCTKSKPNCNACPMRAECRHFASAFASARLALPGPEEKRIVTSDTPVATDPTPPVAMRPMPLPQAENNCNQSAGFFGQSCEPIIEEPTTPEPETAELSISDIEDQYYEDSDEIPSIKLNMEEFTTNLQSIIEDGTELQDNMSKALVALNPSAASIPTPKLKNVSRLRTEHQVYELPDSHRLLEGMDKREPDDPSPYLLAIWTPGETANSVQPPERGCSAQESGKLCAQATCFSCNSIKEANSQVVRGTILIPCRTAMHGSFPLNGTYFQVNEMFADHASSLNPIAVPRAWIWNLPRRTVYFGTSVSTIFKGLTTEGIQYCFWRGFVCVRGFDQKTRAPRPLMARLHFPASKLKAKNEDK